MKFKLFKSDGSASSETEVKEFSIFGRGQGR